MNIVTQNLSEGIILMGFHLLYEVNGHFGGGVGFGTQVRPKMWLNTISDIKSEKTQLHHEEVV